MNFTPENNRARPNQPKKAMNGQNGRRQTGAVAGNPTVWDDGQTQQASRAGGGIARIIEAEEVGA